MSGFDKRAGAEEGKFALDQELRFKANARRNKLLGLWAAEHMGLSEEHAREYAGEVVAADFQEAGDEDVFRKLSADLKAKGASVSDDMIRQKMAELARQFPQDRMDRGRAGTAHRCAGTGGAGYRCHLHVGQQAAQDLYRIVRFARCVGGEPQRPHTLRSPRSAREFGGAHAIRAHRVARGLPLMFSLALYAWGLLAVALAVLPFPSTNGCIQFNRQSA